jgi:hypothetical protein
MNNNMVLRDPLVEVMGPGQMTPTDFAFLVVVADTSWRAAVMLYWNCPLESWLRYEKSLLDE